MPKKEPFTVLAECVDARSGKRFQSGDTFDPPPTVDQAKRLVAAGCLPDGAVAEAEKVEDAGGVDPAAIVRDQLNNDKLFDKSDDELARIVADEGVQVEHGADKVATIAAIRARRGERPARPDPDNLTQRTEAGEREQRALDAARTDAVIDQAQGRSTTAATDSRYGDAKSPKARAKA